MRLKRARRTIRSRGRSARICASGEAKLPIDASREALIQPCCQSALLPEVLELASRLTTVATMRSSLGRVVRNLALRVLGSSPVFRRKLTLNLSGLARKGMGMVPPR